MADNGVRGALLKIASGVLMSFLPVAYWATSSTISANTAYDHAAVAPVVPTTTLLPTVGMPVCRPGEEIFWATEPPTEPESSLFWPQEAPTVTVVVTSISSPATETEAPSFETGLWQVLADVSVAVLDAFGWLVLSRHSSDLTYMFVARRSICSFFWRKLIDHFAPTWKPLAVLLEWLLVLYCLLPSRRAAAPAITTGQPPDTDDDRTKGLWAEPRKAWGDTDIVREERQEHERRYNALEAEHRAADIERDNRDEQRRTSQQQIVEALQGQIESLGRDVAFWQRQAGFRYNNATSVMQERNHTESLRRRITELRQERRELQSTIEDLRGRSAAQQNPSQIDVEGEVEKRLQEERSAMQQDLEKQRTQIETLLRNQNTTDRELQEARRLVDQLQRDAEQRNDNDHARRTTVERPQNERIQQLEEQLRCQASAATAMQEENDSLKAKAAETEAQSKSTDDTVASNSDTKALEEKIKDLERELEQTRIDDDARAQTEAQKNEQKIKDLENQAQKQADTAAAALEEKDKLATQAAELESKLEQAGAETETARQTQTRQGEVIKQQEEAAKVQANAVTTLQMEKEVLQRNMIDLQSRFNELATNNGSQAADQAHLQNTIQEHNNTIAELNQRLQQEVQKFEQEKAENLNMKAEIQEKFEELRQEYQNELRSRDTKTQHEMAQKDGAVDRLNQGVDELKQRHEGELNSRQQQYNDLQRRAQEYERAQEAEKRRLNEEIARLDAINRQITTATNNQSNAEVGRLNNQLATIKAEKDEKIKILEQQIVTHIEEKTSLEFGKEFDKAEKELLNKINGESVKEIEELKETLDTERKLLLKEGEVGTLENQWRQSVQEKLDLAKAKRNSDATIEQLKHELNLRNGKSVLTGGLLGRKGTSLALPTSSKNDPGYKPVDFRAPDYSSGASAHTGTATPTVPYRVVTPTGPQTPGPTQPAPGYPPPRPTDAQPDPAQPSPTDMDTDDDEDDRDSDVDADMDRKRKKPPKDDEMEG